MEGGTQDSWGTDLPSPGCPWGRGICPGRPEVSSPLGLVSLGSPGTVMHGSRSGSAADGLLVDSIGGPRWEGRG